MRIIIYELSGRTAWFELEFYMLPADAAETRTKVALMATSKEELPDVLVVDGHLTNEMILQYGSSGFFLPLNDYLPMPPNAQL